MIPGGNQSPYREPCGGTVRCFNGPRNQHARGKEKNIPVLIYNTLLPVDFIPPRGDVRPYERFKDNSAGTCEVDNCGGGAPAPCVPWICPTGPCDESTYFDLASPPPVAIFYQPQMVVSATLVNPGSGYMVGDQLPVSGGTTSGYITPDGGAFSAEAVITVAKVDGTGAILPGGFSISAGGSYQTVPTSPASVSGGHGTGATFTLTTGGQTENISPCFKFGFKNVQAKRQWHGQPGYFFNSNPALYTCNDSTYGTACDTTVYEQYSLSASQTKYLDASFSVTGSFSAGYDCETAPDNTFNFFPDLFSDTYSGDISVDANSGVITVNSGDYGCGSAAQFAPFVTMTLDQWVTRFTDMLAVDTISILPLANDYFGPAGAPSGSFSLSCDGTGYSFSGWPGGTSGTYPNQSGSGSWTFGGGAFSATRTYTYYNSGPDDGQAETESVSITDSGLTYTYQMQLNVGGTWTTAYDVTLTIAFSSENTATDVLTDIYLLLDEWNLTDDAVYPWRSDSYTSIAPLVTRNEVQSNVAPFDFVASMFTTSATQIDDCAGNAPDAPGYVPTCDHPTASDPNAAIYDGSIIGAPLPAGYQQAFDWYFVDWESCVDPDTHETIGYIEGWGKYNQGQNGIPRTATHWTTNDLAWQLTGGAWVFYNLNTAWSTCTVSGGSATWPAGQVIIAQKWAETKMGFPSENFARPGGDDKFVYDETTVYTIDSITGSGPGAQVKLQLCTSCDTPSGSSQPISSIAGLWGGPSVGGFYTLSALTGGDTVTLGTLVYNVPSDWKSASDWGSGDTDFCFGRLRWATGTPSTDPPPILGRANISDASEYMGDPSTTELTTDSLTNLGMGISVQDSVDIYDKTMSLLSSNQPVTRIDDTHFTIPVGLVTVANAAWVASHGAAAYQWDDQYPKGDYVYNDFTYWPRLICEATRMNALNATCEADTALVGNDCDCPAGAYTVYCFPFFNPFEDEPDVFDHAFTQTAGCVPFNPCSPAVLYITPNTENFQNGVKYSFPTAGGILLDERYGSGWFAEFQQVVVDPLYQTPHYPASAIGGCDPTMPPLFSWLMDDGGCTADNPDGSPAVEYFPHAPLVEARLTVPGGAPSLPPGIALGWASPAGLTDCESVAADVLFPPGPNGYGLSAPLPVWALWGLECGCVDASGRFADEYQNQVVGCN